MNHRMHLYVMGAAVTVAAVLLLTGVGGASLFLILIVGCMVMMFFMMRAMSGGGMSDMDRSSPGHEHGDVRPEEPQDHTTTPR